MRERKRESAQAGPCTSFEEEQQAVWQGKVSELAHRGFPLENLLDFYAELVERGSPMPGFDPRRSTTRDVVRQAIVPLSRADDSSGGMALATKWSRGEPHRAERMVTHAWSNVFAHLVAAIVADACGDSTYERCLLLLEEGKVQALKDMARVAGSLRRSYWVCAFSVNQHSSICGGFGPEPQDPRLRETWAASHFDTVSRQPYTICDCAEPKVFNSTDPARCELNKFDDMMALLARSPGFSQVIAMDRNFELLDRVWCVAELFEARCSQIPQSVVIYREECVEAKYADLSVFDVRNCEASRPEDKAAILAKIPDLDHFSESLQELVFGGSGLLSTWMDARDRLKQVGRLARRARARKRAARARTLHELPELGSVSSAGSTGGGPFDEPSRAESLPD